MANSKTGVQAALRSRLKSIGRSASALRARIEQGFRRQPANDDYQEAAPAPQGPVARKAMAPDGVCIYAIGDIHGRRDLLERLVQLIEEDAATLPEGVKPQIVFLGDYIDRGLQSRYPVHYRFAQDYPGCVIFQLQLHVHPYQSTYLKAIRCPAMFAHLPDEYSGRSYLQIQADHA